MGQQQMIQVQLSALLDLDESLFTQVHAQFRLSSFGNVPGDQDKVFATEPISGFGAGPIPFNYTQNLTTVITNNTTMAQDLTVELYGRAQMKHLNNIVARHIELGKEDTSSGEYNNNSFSKQKGTTSATALPTPPTSKPRPLIRSYTDDELLLLKERHHVVAYLQVCELGKDGEHSPVNVMTYSAQDQGCFYLRQGLQRQLKITMMHDSGLRLPLVKVENVAISNILIMMDQVDNSDGSNKTQTQEPAGFKVVANNDRPVTIPLHQNQPLECHPDGTCILMAQGPWDTSLHDTAHLNRVTASQHRVRATLSWQVVCNKSTGPLVFSMDFYMKIHNRDLAPPNSKSNNSSAILSYFSSAFYQYHRMSYKLRGIFSVHLSPPLSRQASQLWKLNTANKYIRGEELLDPGFGPRGVSLIEDYREAAKRMRRRQQVLETRQTLAAIEQGQRQYQRWSLNHQQQQRPLQQQIINQSSTLKPYRNDADNLDRRKDLLRRTLQLWTARFGSQKEVTCCFLLN
jgi:kinesin family protein 1